MCLTRATGSLRAAGEFPHPPICPWSAPNGGVGGPNPRPSSVRPCPAHVAPSGSPK